MRTSYVVALVVLLAATFKPEISGAYTISVDCQMNPVPPPTIPYQNADCVYAWQQGGEFLNNRGKVEAQLQLWPTAQFMDSVNTGMFALGYATSPFRTWIRCSDIVGDFRMYMTGYLYKYIIGNLGSGGYFSLQQTLSDAEFTHIYSASVPCS
jgi:hypothetical protein